MRVWTFYHSLSDHTCFDHLSRESTALDQKPTFSSFYPFGVFILTTGIVYFLSQNTVWDPEQLLKQIMSHTHYIPDEWKGKAHTKEVGWRGYSTKGYTGRLRPEVQPLTAPFYTQCKAESVPLSYIFY